MSKHIKSYIFLIPLFLFALVGCTYPKVNENWIPINSSEIHLSKVELGNEAIDVNYKTTCNEARDEIETQLINQLPKKIKPLILKTEENLTSTDTAAHLKIEITQCEIDVDQYGGSFTYYLTLHINVSVTENNKPLLSYDMKTDERIEISMPSPAYDFYFTEPVSKIMGLFDGQRLRIPDTSQNESRN